MPFFAVSLLSECLVAGHRPPDPMRELAIHLVRAADEGEAHMVGARLGVARNHAYRNGDGEEVTWAFQRVVEVQALPAAELADGMEVSSWLYDTDRLCLDDDWSA